MRLTGINRVRLISFVFALFLSLSFASAADPGHSAGSIGSGTFESGNYVFPNNLTINSHVGIGTSAPGAGLHVTTIGGNANVSIQTSYGGNTVYYIAKSIASGLNPLVRAGDASIIFTNGTQTNTSASFFIGPWSSNRTGIRITGNGFESIGLFNTTNQSGSFGLFQDFNARIGIGTTTPTHALDVNGIVNASGFLVNGSALTTGSNATDTYVPYTGANDNVDLGAFNITGGKGTFRIGPAGETTEVISVRAGGGSNADGTTSRIAGYTDVLTGYIDIRRFTAAGPNTGIVLGTNSGDLLTLRSTGTSDLGRVGIGLLSPSTKLHVNGTLSVANDTGSQGLYQSSNAYVGIGTAVPNSSLDVLGSSVTGARTLTLRGGDDSTVPANSYQILFSYNGGTFFTHNIRTRHHSTQDVGNAIDFYTWDQGVDAAGTIGTKHVLTLENGEVGIGTTTPSMALDVRGAGNFSGTIYINNNTDIQTLVSGNISAADDWNVSAGTLFPKDLDYNISLGDTIAQGRLYLTGSGAQDLVINSTSNAARIQLYPGSASTQSAIQFYNETKHQVWAIFAAGTSRDFQIFSNAGAGTVLSINKTTGSVGIGTTSPITRLHVGGDAQLADSRPLLILNQTTNLQSWFLENTAESATRGDFAIREDTDSGSIRFIIQNNTGRVGIGTSTPSMALDVRGAGNFSGTVYINNGTDIASLVAGADDWNVSGSDLFPLDLAYNVGIGTNNPAYKFEVNAANNALNVSNYLFANSTSVGIGTTSARVSLDVAGTIYGSGTIAVSNGGPVLTTVSSTHARVRPWASNGNISLTDFNGNGIFLADGGRIGIRNNVPTHTLDLNGTFRMTGINGTTVSESEEFIEIRALGAPAGATTLLGTFSFTNGAGYIEIDHIAHLSGYSTSAKYLIPVQYDNNDQGTSAVWMKVQPISYSGDYSGQEAELDINVSTASAQVRLRRVSGSINASHTLYVKTVGNTVTFTPLNTSSTGESAPTIVYGPSVLTQRSGRVGIGTTAPSTALDVRGAGNFSGTVYINNGTDISALVAGADDWNVSGSNLFPLDLAYNVGIGISSPTAKLYVNQSASAPGLYVEGGANGFDIAHFARRNGAVVDINITGNGGRPQVIFGTGGTSQYAIGYDGSGYFSISSGTDLLSGTSRIAIRDTTGNVGIGVTSPAYKLEVNAATTALNVSNFLFANSTQVGIGTSNPAYGLDVTGTSSVVARISSSSTNWVRGNEPLMIGRSGAAGAIQFARSSDGSAQGYIGYTNGTESSELSIGSDGGGGYIRISTAGSEKLRLTSTGRLGIGTTTPSMALDVRGAGNFSGTVYINNGTDISALVAGADDWNVSGSDLFPLDLAYNVGIGTNNPAYKFEINAANNALNVSNNLYVNSTSVGIGTRTPRSILEINSSASATFRLLVTATTGQRLFSIDNSGNVVFADSIPTINFANANTIGFNDIDISDPGANEGYGWSGTSAGWIIDVSPANRSNFDGNLNLYGTANNISLWRPINVMFNGTIFSTLQTTSQGVLILSAMNNISANNSRITDIATPVGDNDAATKGYVDSVTGGASNASSTYVPYLGALNNVDFGRKNLTTSDRLIISNVSGAANHSIYTDSDGYLVISRMNELATPAIFIGQGNDELHIRSRSTGGLRVAASGADVVLNAIGNANDFHLQTNSATRLHINASSGNIGIGTSSINDNHKLTINAATNALNVSHQLYVNNSMVMIGTATPPSNNADADLYVAGKTLTTSLYVGFGTNPAVIATDDSTKNIRFNVGGADRFILNTSGNLGIGTTAAPAYKLEINSATNALNVSNNLYVNSTQVGIGTANPTFNLEVASGDIFLNSPSGGWPDLLMGAGVTNGSSSYYNVDRSAIYTVNPNGINDTWPFSHSQGYGVLVLQGRNDPSNGGIVLRTGNGNGQQNRLVVKPSGNVGIGTNTPTHPLDVNGVINASGYLVNGSAITTGSNATDTYVPYVGANDNVNLGAFNLTTTGKLGVGTSINSSVALTVGGGVYALTSSGTSFFRARQVGSGYSNSQAIFEALTDNANGGQNTFYRGTTNGTVNFQVRADGQAYFAGNVGIGRSSPAYGLEVNAAANALNVSHMLYVNSTHVGIGTENPINARLQVSQLNAGGESVVAAFQNPSTTSGTAVRLILAGTNDITSNTNGRADILASRRSNGEVDLNFLLSPGGGSAPTSRIYINGTNGRVGVGTTNPLSNLFVSSATNGDSVLTLESDTDNNNEDDNPWIHFKQDNGLVNGFIGLAGNSGTAFGQTVSTVVGNALVIHNNNTDSASYLQLATNNSARLTVTPSGNVGIGTNAPGFLLEVSVNGGTTPVNATTLTHLTQGGDGGPILNFRVEDGNTAVDGSGGNAETLGRIAGWGSYAQDAYMEGTRIDFKPENAFNTTSAPSYISFSTTGLGSTSPTEKVRINAAGSVGIGTTTPGVSNGYAKLELSGTSSSSAGPHIKLTTSADAFPVFQALGWTHDNIGLNFDSYYDGTWRSADAGSNFQLYKLNDAFRLRYDSGITAGSAVTWEEGIVLTSTGNVGIGAPSPTHKLDVNGVINASGILVNGTPLNAGGASGWTLGTGVIYNDTAGVRVGIGGGKSSPSASLDVNGSFVVITRESTGTYNIGHSSYALGLSRNNGNITSSGSASFASGYASSGRIIASSFGSFAQGSADSASNSAGIISSGVGAFAQGYGNSGIITASSNGAFAQGYAVNANITASGSGSRAGGAALGGHVNASGVGAFAWGNGTSSTANYGIVFGQGIVNTIANSFSVGFGNIGTTPTLFVNGSNAGIGTTAPKAKLDVQGDVVLNASATGGNVVIQL